MTKTLTIAIMHPPYESATSTTALRIVNAALAQGNDVTVFAYEGAVNLTMAAQQPHANPVKGSPWSRSSTRPRKTGSLLCSSWRAPGA